MKSVLVDDYGVCLIVNGEIMPQCPRCGRVPHYSDDGRYPRDTFKYRIYCDCDYYDMQKRRFKTKSKAADAWKSVVSSFETNKGKSHKKRSGVIDAFHQNPTNMQRRLNSFHDGRAML